MEYNLLSILALLLRPVVAVAAQIVVVRRRSAARYSYFVRYATQS
jgi:hypothetical protein